MKIGILGDTHDRIERTADAIDLLIQAGAELLIHTGDITEPVTVGLFAGIKTCFTAGNNDWDTQGLRTMIESVGGSFFPEQGDLTLAGKRLGWTHGDRPKRLTRMETCGEYDYVFYGHTHHAEDHLFGHTQVINPGALCRCTRKTCVILDLATGAFRYLEVA